MSDYLAKFRLAAGRLKSGQSALPGVCPFLFYNLAPYVVTLAKGGWFSWAQRTADCRRRPIEKKDFRTKQVNWVYPNEVLVRCPNPQNAVVAGIGPAPDGKLRIRILDVEGTCLQAHAAGQEFNLEADDAARRALDFNVAFPTILAASLGPAQQATIDESTPVGIHHITYSCRYHKEKKTFNAPLLPGGFCSHAFAAAYPYVLALMYNATVEKELNIRCPQGGCALALQLEKKRSLKHKITRPFLRAMEIMFEAVFHPVDLIDYDLGIRLVNVARQHPGCRLKKGASYPVNLHSPDFICPASFHALYPYLLLKACGKAMEWNDPQGLGALPCPDCVGVSYSFGRQGVR
ncbi:MAG TPA: hypothetical protein VMD52_06060 [Patescibacteria group bacterium]|nr:hypothetical protein [Patescibacteria group bacterium]